MEALQEGWLGGLLFLGDDDACMSGAIVGITVWKIYNANRSAF
jgi:hypothetical protein